MSKSFLSDADQVIKALDDYYRKSVTAQGAVIHQEPLAQVIATLQLDDYVKTGGLSGAALGQFLERYLALTTRLHHPAYMAHQVAVPHYAGALGSLIDGFTNNAMAIYEMGPAAASIEYFVINWMLEKVGWQPAPLDLKQRNGEVAFGGGVLTHGGSLANLTAMIVARNRVAPESWDQGVAPGLALLAPPGAHYSLARAASIIGLGQKAIYPLAVDRRGAIIPEQLSVAHERARQDGRQVMAVVANACSTAVGIYDPLEEIGQFCRAQGLWLHVDGAHGASALVSAKHRQRLAGIELADSLTWDAHKMLQTPTLCAALLVRDHRPLDIAFQQDASYLFHEKNQPGIDQGFRTVECTKAGLGLKLFLVLGALGESGLAQFIDRQYALAQEAYAYMRRQPDLECALPPESNILCFRFTGSDQRQLQIRDALNVQGKFYLSSTAFQGKRYLRMALMNPHTRLAEIENLVDDIRQFNHQWGPENPNAPAP